MFKYIVEEDLELRLLDIHHAEDNIKSRAIPERLDFTQEGIIRDGELLNGNFVNCVVYGILKREWEKI